MTSIRSDIYENILKSYCPDIVLSKLYRRREQQIEVEAKSARGACLLADISGFTKLSGQLCSNGVRGLDDLRQVTSNFLSKFITLVYAFGGDVVSFAGDALVCIFWCDNLVSLEEDQRVCKNAVECGYLLKEHCTDQLTAHIAISLGELCFSFLGGYNNDWVYVVNGKCMAELSTCIEDAASKELVITSDCFCSLDREFISNLTFTRLESKNYLINTLTLSEKSNSKISTEVVRKHSRRGGLSYNHHILRFLPPPVVTSFKDGYFESISELRNVTTLFLKIDTYSYEKHRKLTSLQTFFFSIQTAISLTGGCLRQFLVDDKGCVLIVLWGVPSATFANNGARSVYCATQIQKSAQKLRHICSVGITTGSAFCGTIGSPLRQDYAAIGNSVNMAARLMGKACGRILIDVDTSLSLPETIRQHLEQIEPLRLKGASTPVAAFSFRIDTLQENTFSSLNIKNLRGLTVSIPDPRANINPSIETPMVPMTPGFNTISPSHEFHQRESIAQKNLSPEITSTLTSVVNRLKNIQLSQHNNNSNDIPMQVLVVEGTQGMGKTEVATYFRNLCQENSIRCYSIQATSEDEMTEYGITRKLFNLLINEDLQTSPRRKETLLGLLHRTYPSLSPEDIVFTKFPLVKQALSLHWHLSLRTYTPVNIPIPDFKKSKSSRYLLAPTLVDITEALVEDSPTTIIIDDAHYCDRLTWNYLHMMSITLKIPLVLVIIVRKLSIEEMMIPYMMLSNRNLDVNGDTPDSGESKIFAQTPRATRLKKARGFRFKKTPVMVAVDSLLQNTIVDNPECANMRLHLSELSFIQTKNILISALPSTTEISDSFVELVCEVSSRNPYWCVAIADFVHEVGVKNFCKAIDATTSLTVTPSTQSRRPKQQLVYLRHLVTCMMDLLTVTEQIVLKYASVMGLKFFVSILVEILPKGDAQKRLSKALKTLVDRRFIMRYPSEESVYTFQNYNIREVIYSLIPPSDAAALHLKIAEEIESQYESNLRPHYDTLMYHYMMSIKLSSNIESKHTNQDSESDSNDSYNQRRKFDARNKVFKFATKAVREAVAMSSMTSAMEYLEFGSTIASSAEENEKLLKLTDEAIGELQSSTSVDLGESHLHFSNWEAGDAELLDFREKICSKLTPS